MPPVAFGDHVRAKHRNGRYYHAIVLSVSSVHYYKVAFDDGSYSNDMYPEDIEVSKIHLIHWHVSYYSITDSKSLLERKGAVYKQIQQTVQCEQWPQQLDVTSSVQ